MNMATPLSPGIDRQPRDVSRWEGVPFAGYPCLPAMSQEGGGGVSNSFCSYEQID